MKTRLSKSLAPAQEPTSHCDCFIRPLLLLTPFFWYLLDRFSLGLWLRLWFRLSDQSKWEKAPRIIDAAQFLLFKFCLCDISVKKNDFSRLLCCLLLRYFSEKPHIAGSTRQTELALELVNRWKDKYGFDKVEMPKYKALLSKPDMDKKTRVTLKYKNGTIIYQVKGEEQV